MSITVWPLRKASLGQEDFDSRKVGDLDLESAEAKCLCSCRSLCLQGEELSLCHGEHLRRNAITLLSLLPLEGAEVVKHKMAHHTPSWQPSS